MSLYNNAFKHRISVKWKSKIMKLYWDLRWNSEQFCKQKLEVEKIQFKEENF